MIYPVDRSYMSRSIQAQDIIKTHKGVYPQSDGSLAMAFDEYISMH